MTTSTSKNAVCVSDTRYGRLTHFEFDDPIGRSLKVYGEWAQVEIDFLTRFVKPGETVFDVGANVGTHTLALAAAVGPTGHVVAIEPQPAIFRLLSDNVAANGLANVALHAVAVSNATGAHSLTVPDYAHRHNSGVATLDSESGPRVEVPTVRLDEFHAEACALLKLDIEGWEDKAIAGAASLIEKFRPLIYAECNTVEKGWRVMESLKRAYVCFLHSPPAYNLKNFKKNSENVFGIAEETNLFLVPEEKLADLEPLLATQQHLLRIRTLDDLSSAFARATRYGETEMPPERAYALSRRLQALEKELVTLRRPSTALPEETRALPASGPRLTRPVQVIVPVYNGLTDFERLVQSLFYTHPKPDPLLKFVFIDDGSPDPGVAAFLKDKVFDRPDVVRLENARNRGFIGTVNRGLELCALGPSGTDVIILNTDTLIFGNVFAIMQDVASRLPNVASVTPVTNNGTIASIFAWPHGGELFGMLEPEMVSQAVEASHVPTPMVDVPTGVGFCMYMTHAALDAVGTLDPAFGRGYGEENHWCQQAAKRGFVNLLTTEAFVYHHGSQSFGDETRRTQLEKNLQLLHTLHPNYHTDVMRYIEADPQRGARVNVLWALRRQAKLTLNLHTVLYLIHTDPTYYGGGTERHVMGLTEHLLTEGRTEVLHLFPDSATGQWILRCYFPRSVKDTQSSELLVARFDPDEVLALLTALAPDVDTLHVHSALGWPTWFTQVPSLFAASRRLLTLHDYYALCPSIRLMKQGRYCGLPADLGACNRCLSEEQGVQGARIEDYRTNSAHFVEQFTEVYTPSEAARLVLQQGFSRVAAPGRGTLADVTTARVTVAPNPLLDTTSEGRPSLEPRAATAAVRVVFLGAYCEAKGADLFQEAAAAMLRRDWAVEVWGTLGMALPEGVTHRRYTNPSQLRALARSFPCDVVAVPAVWPETFSFTTFESVLDVGAPVVVGPFGNPAEVVRRHGIGEVLETLTAEGLVEKVAKVVAHRLDFSRQLEAFAAASTRFTLENYLNQVYAHRTELRVPGPLRPLPAPATRRTFLQPREPEQPLRYRLVDQTNDLIKQGTPWLHTFGRQLGSWAARRGRKA